MPEHTPAPTPNRAVYGFVLNLVFKAIFLVFLAWAILPPDVFATFGITYLPQRYWALAIPMFLLTVITVSFFIVYPSLGLIMNPNSNDIRTVTGDAVAKIDNVSNMSFTLFGKSRPSCVCKNSEKCVKHEFDAIDSDDFVNKAVPPLVDLNMADISRHLYLNKRKS